MSQAVELAPLRLLVLALAKRLHSALGPVDAVNSLLVDLASFSRARLSSALPMWLARLTIPLALVAQSSEVALALPRMALWSACPDRLPVLMFGCLGLSSLAVRLWALAALPI